MSIPQASAKDIVIEGGSSNPGHPTANPTHRSVQAQSVPCGSFGVRGTTTSEGRKLAGNPDLGSDGAKAGPHAPIEEESKAEKRALYVVAVTFFLLAAYITYEGLSGLLRHQEPLTSPVGIALSVLSLVVMPIVAYAIGWKPGI